MGKYHLYIVCYSFNGSCSGSIEIFLKKKWTKGTMKKVFDLIKNDSIEGGVEINQIALSSVLYCGKVKA